MIGSLYGTVFYYISKNLFVYYTSAAVSTNVIYGSLAILPFLMLWLYLFWIIVLSSVKLSFIHQNFSGLALFVRSRGFGRGDKIRIAMDILKIVYQEYEKGDKVVVTEKKVSTITNNPIYIISSITEQLVKNNILVKTVDPENGLLPSTGADKVNIQEIVDGLDNQNFTSLTSSSDTINKLFTKNGNLTNEIGKKLLKDIF
jgi:membrane protein